MFLLNFFGWLVLPVDTDGDGLLTLLDAYKWAAIQTNEYLRQLKVRQGLDSADKYSKYQGWVEELKKPEKLTPDRRLVLEQQVRRFRDMVDGLFLHQEPWITNASLASEIVLDSP